MRQKWLDILKGIGIIAVVVGHVMNWRYVYSFHMPLFFLISGYTFHVRENEVEWFVKCCRRYLLPYFSFMLSFSLYTLLLTGKRLSLYKILYGGSELLGIYGTFWFITVLFLSLLLLNVIVKRHISIYASIIVCLLLSYIFQYEEVSVRWNAQIVPMALAYMLMGYEYKINVEMMDSIVKSGKYRYLLQALILCACIVPVFFLQIRIDMKQTDFGVPVLSLIVSLLICLGFSLFSKWLESRKTIVAGVLIFIGKASLVIMFMHQFFKEVLFDVGIEKRSIRFVLAILLPTAIYYLLEKNRLTKACFWGNNSSIIIVV